MKRLKKKALAFSALALVAATVTYASYSGAANDGRLKVGAARIEITPPVDELPEPFKTVSDTLYVRAVVMDTGEARSVMVIIDAPTMNAGIAANLTQQISKQAKLPAENILLGTSHTHNVMRVDYDGKSIIPGSTKFVNRVVAATLAAVKQAEADLQPARVGYASGKLDLIANRNEWHPQQHRYIDGIDRTGEQPIDQRLGVIEFQSLSGTPIAFVLNYAIEPVVMNNERTKISGDVPGAASRYIEDRLGGKAVAMFTIGAAGSPRYRSHPDTVYGQSDPQVIMNAMGAMLGEEAIETAKSIKYRSSNIKLGGASEKLQCPGKVTKPMNLPNQCAYSAQSKLPQCVFTDTDREPVTLSMSMLKIGDVALIQADANVTPALGQKLQKASPMANTMIVALTYGPMHYVVDDAAYPYNTYEATASIAKQGCAEEGFITKSLSMMSRLH